MLFFIYLQSTREWRCKHVGETIDSMQTAGELWLLIVIKEEKAFCTASCIQCTVTVWLQQQYVSSWYCLNSKFLLSVLDGCSHVQIGRQFFLFILRGWWKTSKFSIISQLRNGAEVGAEVGAGVGAEVGAEVVMQRWQTTWVPITAVGRY